MMSAILAKLSTTDDFFVGNTVNWLMDCVDVDAFNWIVSRNSDKRNWQHSISYFCSKSICYSHCIELLSTSLQRNPLVNARKNIINEFAVSVSRPISRWTGKVGTWSGINQTITKVRAARKIKTETKHLLGSFNLSVQLMVTDQANCGLIWLKRVSLAARVCTIVRMHYVCER